MGTDPIATWELPLLFSQCVLGDLTLEGGVPPRAIGWNFYLVCRILTQDKKYWSNC